ncbi:hypothetical protein GCE9029_01419 [Grimontia celer]|uniref:Uncharacterized protein n=1 Tax=Grimontia celer TaxID=1796497 RepID=A0A128EZD4_9GAMM|nr:hypothetical protein [Grimontia celer]CZF79366.1 hypothetical protein GCE9029_01419 [Grimontia celer]
MANRLSKTVCFVATLLLGPMALANTPGGESRSFPDSEQMKSTLSAMGFNEPWSMTDGGEKQPLNNGELWIREGNYFAVMSVRDDNEQAMQLSLINNLSVCAQLGIAATGDSSKSVFSAFSHLTGKALTQPETTASNEQSPFHYHVLITEMIAERTLMQCGVKNQ